MLDTRTQAILQVIFQREGRSFLLYVHDAFPWTESAGEPALERLQRLIASERTALTALGRYMLRQRVPLPFVGSFPSSFTSFNFLALDHLLPKLIDAEKRLLDELERDRLNITDTGAQAELTKLADQKRRTLNELGEFIPPFRNRRVPDVAALIDTHAHLDAEHFTADLPAVLARARTADVTRIVTVATTAASSASTVTLAASHPGLFPTAGIHPNNAAQAAATDWDAVVALAETPAVVGIGETGLDRHWNDTPFPMQEDYFVRHLHLSRRLHKPIIIHCREADADMVRVLKDDFDRFGPILGVMHSFVGDAAMAETCRALGLYLSFAGMLTYKNAEELRSTATKQPLDRLLVETDSPYLSPVPLRGKRNEPANVRHTAACLAGLHGIDLESLAAITTRNACALFRLT